MADATGQQDAAAGYEAFMGRWSRALAPQFVAWLAVAPQQRWLDVGCGTGALAAAILQGAAPRELWGVDSAEEYIEYARRALPEERCRFMVGDAQSLPNGLGSFDATVSGLTINLVPDPSRALAEMIRVTRPGAVIGAYVWDFASGMQLLRFLWDAAAELDAAAKSLDQAQRDPICKPDRLHALFSGAGLGEVDMQALEILTVLRDFDDYWGPLEAGLGYAPGYVASLPPAQRHSLRERLRSRLAKRADGSIPLMARAWAIRGIRVPQL